MWAIYILLYNGFANIFTIKGWLVEVLFDIGSKLDAVKTDREHNLKVWAKATVINVEGELIQVQYEND